jgi:hypothetical protein
MTDTTREMAARYEALLFSRSPEDRFEMGARMFDSARAMVLASFPPGLSTDEVRRRLFARFYGHDMPAHLVPEALRPR